MKLIIAGTRSVPLDLGKYWVENALVESGWVDKVTEVVSGCASGIDRAGEEVAHGRWKIRRMPADWAANGRAAGPIRNRQMAEYADALLAVWDGESKGTRNMIDTAEALGLEVFVYKYDPKDVALYRKENRSGL